MIHSKTAICSMYSNCDCVIAIAIVTSKVCDIPTSHPHSRLAGRLRGFEKSSWLICKSFISEALAFLVKVGVFHQVHRARGCKHQDFPTPVTHMAGRNLLLVGFSCFFCLADDDAFSNVEEGLHKSWMWQRFSRLVSAAV